MYPSQEKEVKYEHVETVGKQTVVKPAQWQVCYRTLLLCIQLLLDTRY